MKRVGILGGTFDPPHIGHLIIAEEARLALNLDEIWFIPTAGPPHKTGTMTSSQHQLKRFQLAIMDNPAFMVNELEIKREEKSYKSETMVILKSQNQEPALYFIIAR